MTDPLIERLRRQIAERDRRILEAMNARLELVAQLKRHKREIGVEFVDPAQEQRLLAALDETNTGPLSAQGLRQLFAEILALTKRELD